MSYCQSGVVHMLHAYKALSLTCSSTALAVILRNGRREIRQWLIITWSPHMQGPGNYPWMHLSTINRITEFVQWVGKSLREEHVAFTDDPKSILIRTNTERWHWIEFCGIYQCHFLQVSSTLNLGTSYCSLVVPIVQSLLLRFVERRYVVIYKSPTHPLEWAEAQCS